MIQKFTKKTLFLGMSIITIAPVTFLLSCSNQANDVANQLLDLELKNFIQLTIDKSDANLEKINLLNLGINDENLNQINSSESSYNNNEQLANIFVLPEPKIAETNNDYGIFYSWDFTKKDIVSFDLEGNIEFEINVNVGLRESNKFVSKPKKITINIEKTTIIDQGLTKSASRYVYNGKDSTGLTEKSYKFQAVRQDVFDAMKKFNVDFYSESSIITNRPVYFKDKATDESAVDAYSSKSLVLAPEQTSTNGNKYSFGITSAGFYEENPRQGIYKVRVSPTSDIFFNNSLIKYAKDNYGVSFDKHYYYHEVNKTFKNPTESNISQHKSVNSSKASAIGNSISSSSLAFMPAIKNPGVIIGKTAEEIVKINNETPGGIFSPPRFVQQFTIEPIKRTSISISSVTTTQEEMLIFSMIVKVGNASYEMSNTVNKSINIKEFI